MKEQLIKGKVLKRRIKVIKIVGDSFQAFCFSKRAKRTIMIDSVLAVSSSTRGEQLLKAKRLYLMPRKRVLQIYR